MLHKKKPLNIKIRQKYITYVSLLLNTALIGIFHVIIYICKPGAIYGRISSLKAAF